MESGSTTLDFTLDPPPHAPPAACRQQLARCSWAAAKRARSTGAAERPLALTHVRLLDVRSGRLSQHSSIIVCRAGRVESIDAQVPPPDAVVLDCGGRVCMPGLCDAHVHVTACTADLSALYGLPESLVSARAADVLEGMLARGFTTVRDCGGADWGLAHALDEGSLLGPRLLFTGHALSQTGGHGDFRARGEEVCACGPALRGIGRVCDGVDACRTAARDELRKGAHCIKIMASGGVASPTDRLTHTQFSMDELRAIVEEAAAAGTYVAAHAYTPAAIARAIDAGVRSIEHGNWLDDDTAKAMAAAGAFLVPTTITYAALQREGEAAGMPAELVVKVGQAVQQGQRSMALARAYGVRQVYGSDLLGQLHRHQGAEFLLRAEAGIPAAELLASATLTAAQLFNMEGELGEIVPGAFADIILVDGDPLDDVACLAGCRGWGNDVEGSNGDTQRGSSNVGCGSIPLVLKEGLLAKVPHAALLDVNQALLLSSSTRQHRF